ncbi:hypothetical protein BVIET440_70274 [Burkholderia vietnamiensis]
MPCRPVPHGASATHNGAAPSSVRYWCEKLSRSIYYSVAPYFIAFEEIRGAGIVKSS